MKHFLIPFLLLLSGAGLSIQGSINGTLGKTTGVIQAAFISFLVGTFGLLIVLFFVGKGNISAVLHVPKWQLLGGILGATFIVVFTFFVMKVGVGLAVVSVIVGQVFMGMLIDHYGWFHSTQILFSSQRLIGVILLISGLFFIYRGT